MPRNEPQPPHEERTETPLPQHLEAERFLLAALLADSSIYPTISEQVRVEDFTVEPNRRIFKRIGGIISRGETLEIVSLADELKRMRELDLVGGLSYLVSLAEGMPRIHHPEVYAKIVRDKAALRGIIVQGRSMALKAMAQEESAEEIIAAAQTNLNKMFDTARTDGSAVQTPEQVVQSIGYGDFMEPWRKNPPISTGYPDLDNLLYGFIPGNVYIIGGDTSDGKSVSGMSFLENLCVAGVQTMIFSCEMDKQTLIHRMMCGRAGVSQKRFKTGNVDEEDRRRLNQALSVVMDMSFKIDDTPGISIADLEIRLRRAVRESGVKFVVIDYIQFMNLEEAGDGQHKFRDDNHALSFISKRITTLARELNIIVLVLSQFNKAIALRKGKDRRPQLNDLYGSGSLKKDAYCVILLYREWRHHPERDDIKKLVEFIVAKHRNGPTGTVEMEFSRGYTRFELAQTQTHLNYTGDN